MSENQENTRKDYLTDHLDRKMLSADPFEQFEKWFAEAKSSGLEEPNAMALATSTPDGRPSVRMVLLKEHGREGFIFYTNYESRKGKELEENSRAALLFYWENLERQIRIEGTVNRVAPDKSDNYFDSRPAGARAGAVVSKQSSVIHNRDELEKAWRELEDKSKTEKIVRPDHWGGYLVRPDRFEFWQGRENRLHDRFIFERGQGGWDINRLAP